MGGWRACERGATPPISSLGYLVPVVYRQENSFDQDGTGSVSAAGSTASTVTIDAQSIADRQVDEHRCRVRKGRKSGRLQAGYCVWLVSSPACLSW